MITITYWHLICFITLIWIVSRIIVCTINKKFTLKRELKLLMVYVCIVVICRMVYFPLHQVDGHIGTLTFDKNRVFPFWTNIKPFTFDSKECFHCVLCTHKTDSRESLAAFIQTLQKLYKDAVAFPL